MSNKEEALQDIVSIAKHNNITLDEIGHALETSPLLLPSHLQACYRSCLAISAAFLYLLALVYLSRCIGTISALPHV